MENPLSMLLKYILNKKQIIIQDDRINFGNEYYWPANTKTNYIIYGTGKGGMDKDYYTLKAILFFLDNLNFQHSVYVQKAVAANVQAVRRPDRKNLLAYLNGEVATTDSIDKLAQLENLSLIICSTNHSNNITELRKRSIDTVQNKTIEDVEAKKARFAEIQKVKEQLAAKLHETKENCVVVDELKSLSESMTVEKIAAIKAKRLVKKRTMIKSHDDLGTDVEMHFDTENNTKILLAHERRIRNRKNILQSENKNFASTVFTILKSIKQREIAKTLGTQIPSTLKSAPKQSLSVRQLYSIAYNRYDQQRFNKQEETMAGFTIQTTNSMLGQSINSIADEKPVLTQHLSQVPDKSQPNAPKKKQSTTPIIVIPSSNLSLITILNATDILQDLRFVTNEKKRATVNKKESNILIQRRKSGGFTVPYRVLENPLKLSSDEWQRVVAIFVVGPTWQFKGWPIYSGNPVNIFSRISAFHLKYDDMPVNANVARWPVKIINISRTKRYLDKAAFLQFWEVLDKEMIEKKTHLRL